MPDERTTPRSFESALAEFETLVEKMERGDLSLEDSVSAYERGVVLHGYCERALSEAERKVRILTEGDGGAGERLRPFGTEPEDPGAPGRDEPVPAPRDTAPRPPAGGAPEEDDLPF